MQARLLAACHRSEVRVRRSAPVEQPLVRHRHSVLAAPHRHLEQAPLARLPSERAPRPPSERPPARLPSELGLPLLLHLRLEAAAAHSVEAARLRFLRSAAAAVAAVRSEAELRALCHRSVVAVHSVVAAQEAAQVASRRRAAPYSAVAQRPQQRRERRYSARRAIASAKLRFWLVHLRLHVVA